MRATLAGRAVWDEPPSSTRTCGHTGWTLRSGRLGFGLALLTNFGFSRTLRADWACTCWLDRGETWTHVHGALLVSSRLLSFVPSALQVTRVLPSPDDVIIEATPRVLSR